MITEENIQSILRTEIAMISKSNPKLKVMGLAQEHYDMLCASLGQKKVDLYGGYIVEVMT